MDTQPIRTAVEVTGVAAPAGHYSHGIVTSGRLLFVAGQVAHDEDGNLVGGNDAAAQARQISASFEQSTATSSRSSGASAAVQPVTTSSASTTSAARAHGDRSEGVMVLRE